MQDKPAELQNMAALNVIQGRSEYAGLRNIGEKFYHVQTFPYPKDSATSYEKGWVVVGNTGNRHWESRTRISGTEAPSINRTLLFFLAITLFCGIWYGFSKNITWKIEIPSGFKNIRQPRSWRSTWNMLMDIVLGVLELLLPNLTIVSILIALGVTFAGWLSIKILTVGIENFGFLDFLLKSAAFLIAIYTGIIFGNLLRLLRQRGTEREKMVAVVA